MRTAIQLLQNVKACLRPDDFYSNELPEMPSPRGGGWREGGLCPFHLDKSIGSFRVHLETGAFICFSCGAKGGDIIAFIQQRDGLSFPEAVQKLTEEWGL